MRPVSSHNSIADRPDFFRLLDLGSQGDLSKYPSGIIGEIRKDCVTCWRNHSLDELRRTAGESLDRID